MPTALFPKEEILHRLTDTFRRLGYDAATLNRLAAETGLVKASLYHYFPNGKKDMGLAVLGYLGDRFQTEVLDPFQAQPEAHQAFGGLVENLSSFYDQGYASCLMEVFTLGSARDLFADNVRQRLSALRGALAAKAEMAGVRPKLAETRATTALTLIQGALVIARGLGQPELFAEQTASLPGLMLAPASSVGSD